MRENLNQNAMLKIERFGYIMKVATAFQMRNIDSEAIKEYGIPGIVLMENAAIRAAEYILDEFLSGNCVVVCGRGNNGGDGFAIARHLHNAGLDVCIAFFDNTDKFTHSAAVNYGIAVKMNIPIITDIAAFGERARHCDFIVDALYGVGFRGAAAGGDKQVIDAVNRSDARVYAVDIPSGVNADIGILEGEAVRADVCITFTAYKPAHWLFPAADYCGDVVVCDIGVPSEIVESQGIALQTVEKSHIAALIPKRTRNSHKGAYGKVFVVAGSIGMSGAAYLSATAAARTGAGLVTLAVPAEIGAIIEGKTTEVMSLPMRDRHGVLVPETAQEIVRKANAADVLLFGPGLSLSDNIFAILGEVLNGCTVPVVIDADGINALSGDISVLKRCKAPVVITPHSAEMARLCGVSVNQIEQKRVEYASEFARTHGVTVVLKGAYSLIATPSEVYINTGGNAGMATGGSGDVLSGIIAALIAGGLSSGDAAVCGVCLHSIAGDIAADELGMQFMLACDIMDRIGRAYEVLR